MIEVTTGYFLPPEEAESSGWQNTAGELLNRISRGMDYCTSEPADEDARDLLCILCLTYEARYKALPTGFMHRLNALVRTEQEAA